MKKNLFCPCMHAERASKPAVRGLFFLAPLGQRWPPGLYLLSIRIGDITTSRKVIKQ